MPLGKPRNHGCRISDEWTLAGMRAVILENEQLRVVVLVDKGSDIVEFRYKPLDLDFLYRAPGGIRNMNRGVPSSAGGFPYLDYFSGGWNEILPNGGPPVTYKGAELGQHGEISLLPWEYAIVVDAPEKVAVRLWIRPLRTPLFLTKTLSLEPGRAVLTIEEELVNEGGEAFDLMWGQHIAFGRPFLDDELRIDAPAGRFLVHEAMPGYEPRRFQPGVEADWPLVPAPDGSTANAATIPSYGAVQAQEMAYITDLQEGWYAITNPIRNVGFGLRFDPSLFSYLWYWQQLGDVAQGYPWWSRTHVAALEPWTSYPTNGLPEAVANGSALQLQPGQRVQTQLKAVAYRNLAQVLEISADGTAHGLPGQ